MSCPVLTPPSILPSIFLFITHLSLPLTLPLS
jgi:hypothetical protein